jgi:hypothetical protein
MYSHFSVAIPIENLLKHVENPHQTKKCTNFIIFELKSQKIEENLHHL